MEEKEEKEEQGQEKEERKEPQKKVALKQGATNKEKALALFAANYFLYKQGRRTTWGQKMQLIRENGNNDWKKNIPESCRNNETTHSKRKELDEKESD